MMVRIMSYVMGNPDVQRVCRKNYWGYSWVRFIPQMTKMEWFEELEDWRCVFEIYLDSVDPKVDEDYGIVEEFSGVVESVFTEVFGSSNNQ